MRLLGLSAFHRDSAAALLQDGACVAAAQEGKHTRKHLDSGMPSRAIRYCLDEAGLQSSDLDHVVFYEKPLRKFERQLVQQLRGFPRSSTPFAKVMFLWLGDRLWLKSRLASEVGIDQDKLLFAKHLESHAASAFFPSPFEEAAILVADDGGEWGTTALMRGAGNRLETLSQLPFPHSLGLFASAMAQFLGFEPGAEEDRMELLSAQGEPRFADALRGLFRDLDDGSIGIDLSYFRFQFDPKKLYDDSLEDLFGPARAPGSALRWTPEDPRDADLAASVQLVLEERILGLAQRLQKETGLKRLCFAGALARNRRLCARLLEDGPFDELHVPPCPEDAGGALGAALWAHHVALDQPRLESTWRPGLGETIDDRAEEGARELGSPQAVQGEVDRRLAAGETVAWCQGPMDFAEGSLGSRSLLHDVGSADGSAKLLGSVKLSESWLSPELLMPADSAQRWIPDCARAPGSLAAGRLAPLASEQLQKDAPAAVDSDGRVRPLLVHATSHPDLHALLQRVGERTGAPLLLHQTFHLRGAPTVRNEGDAVDAFRRSSIDALVSGTRLYEQES